MRFPMAIALFFLLLPDAGMAQLTDSSFFAIDFRSDSSGTLGLRSKFRPYTLDNEKATLKGNNLAGYTREQIVKILGQPNNSTEGKNTRKKEFNIDYYLSDIFEHEGANVRYVLIIFFTKGVVSKVSEVMEEVVDADRITR